MYGLARIRAGLWRHSSGHVIQRFDGLPGAPRWVIGTLDANGWVTEIRGMRSHLRLVDAVHAIEASIAAREAAARLMGDGS